jgi:hypothetical protein
MNYETFIGRTGKRERVGRIEEWSNYAVALARLLGS